MNLSRKPELSDFPIPTYIEPKRIPLKDCQVKESDYPLWFKYPAAPVAMSVSIGFAAIYEVLVFINNPTLNNVLGVILLAPIVYGIVWVLHGILRHSVIAGYSQVAYQNKRYQEELQRYQRLVREAPAQREARYREALEQWEQQRQRCIERENAEEQRRQREEQERMLAEQQKIALRERIRREELAADERMSKSMLVPRIAQCILPTFKQIVENVDTEAHMKVRVRLALEVRADTIDYYDAAAPQNRSRFIFAEEGIAEKLSPILRKALCKALVTELRLLILEAFPIDPERKMVQADLEGTVVLKSNVTYIPGRDYTAPEYDANSHAYAVILYQASRDKEVLHF